VEPSPGLLAVVTEITLRHWWQVPRLLEHSGPLIVQARTLPGNHRAEATVRGPRVWLTLTIWDDEAALRGFLQGALHRLAMRETARLAAHTRFGRAWVPDAAAVRWRDARRWLREAPTSPAL
jgi:heme-degrading monooxygenase HmoA